MLKECKIHGLTEYAIDKRGWKRCKACGYDSVRRQRRRNKEKLVNLHGGKCVICGYDRCLRALEFHHLDPSTKEFNVSANTRVAKFDNLKKESEKCILVCANCHVEIEDGLINLDEW